MERGLTIGRVARAADVNVETIRYYQRRGLIAEPERPWKGVRHYAQDAIRRVRFIKRAQQLGFSLAEIENLLRLERTRSCSTTRDLAWKKLEVVKLRLADLQRLKRTLATLIAQCDAGNHPGHCPIIESLTD